MSILTIGILATMQMGWFTVRNVTSGNVVTQATLLAQSRIEQIKRTTDLKDLPGDFIAEPNAAVLDGNEQPVVDSALFNITYSFSDPISGDAPGGTLPNCATGSNDGSGTCLAVVTVAWQRGGGGRGGNGQVEMHTLTHGADI